MTDHALHALAHDGSAAALPPVAPRLVELGGPAPAAPSGARRIPGEVVTAPLIDLDPALGAELSPALRAQVRHWLVVPVCDLPRGPAGAGLEEQHDLAGVLVVGGVLARSVSVGAIAYPELLGPGDLMRPWRPGAGTCRVAFDVDWHVIEPCRLALLDRRLLAIAGRWPELVGALMSRALDRARELDVNMAIAQLPRLELRLLAVLWHLADRWGRPTPEGMLVPVRLTHSVLGGLVLGRRPTVSTSLSELAARGLVSRCDDGWLLHGEPPAALRAHAGHGAGAVRPR
ncbi:MAG: family transcriptional regulator, cyclic receptor protein [Solirubrobacteraceae bacterium]|nr:family transcriptional regulator, cyclic receptor protein [Solirubrobacteraceae bacterium]